jgi:hypothetical protein
VEDKDVSEALKLMKLLIGCAVNSHQLEPKIANNTFIGKIIDLDAGVQKTLMVIIKDCMGRLPKKSGDSEAERGQKDAPQGIAIAPSTHTSTATYMYPFPR